MHPKPTWSENGECLNVRGWNFTNTNIATSEIAGVELFTTKPSSFAGKQGR